MNFGEMLEKLKAGQACARTGWNGKGMFIYLVQAGKYEPTSNVAIGHFEGELVPYQAYIAFKTVDNTVVPWVASQSDILATDWIGNI